jgi:hypothetical protein
MKKLMLIFAAAVAFSFQACHDRSSEAKVDTNENTRENSQSVMDANNGDSDRTDSSNAKIEEHTRMNQAAEEADPNR